eukprot:8836017-Pyramimonas_sp.AAC.1
MSCARRGHGAQSDDDMLATCARGPPLGLSWGPLGAPRKAPNAALHYGAAVLHSWASPETLLGPSWGSFGR